MNHPSRQEHVEVGANSTCGVHGLRQAVGSGLAHVAHCPGTTCAFEDWAAPLEPLLTSAHDERTKFRGEPSCI